KDRVWVSAVSGRIQRFTKDGKFLRGFGEQGTKPAVQRYEYLCGHRRRGDRPPLTVGAAVPDNALSGTAAPTATDQGDWVSVGTVAFETTQKRDQVDELVHRERLLQAFRHHADGLRLLFLDA